MPVQISNLEERIAAAQGAKASPGKKPLIKPAAQAAGAAANKPATAQEPRLALDQGASNSLGVASVGEVHAAPSGSEPAASLTSPRSAAATAGHTALPIIWYRWTRVWLRTQRPVLIPTLAQKTW